MAKRKNEEDLAYEILSIVEEIPRGCVATYGQIARLAGREKNSRLVGRVLKTSSLYGHFPCHRVVNHAGRLVPGWADQQYLLEKEGVTFKKPGFVDIKKHLWDI